MNIALTITPAETTLNSSKSGHTSRCVMPNGIVRILIGVNAQRWTQQASAAGERQCKAGRPFCRVFL